MANRVQTRYEAHILGDDGLPFVFHKDTVRKNELYYIANWHRNIEILFFVEGEGTAICDTNSYEVVPGDIIVINSNSIHYVKSEGVVKYYCLIADADFCSANGIETDSITFQNHIRDGEAAQKYKNVVNEYASRTQFYGAGIRCSVLSLILYVARNFSEDTSALRSGGGKKAVENMKLALGFVMAHYTEQLSVDDIAEEVGLSKYHFSREFKKVTGISPVSYINMLRCEKAKRMLSEGNSVAEVQEMCGFENASYFTKVFKKFSGTTPVAYVKKQRFNKNML